SRHEERPRGGAPPRQPDLEESVVTAAGRVREVEGGRSRPPEPGRRAHEALEGGEVAREARQLAEGGPGRDKRVVEGRGPGARDGVAVQPGPAPPVAVEHLVVHGI